MRSFKRLSHLTVLSAACAAVLLAGLAPAQTPRPREAEKPPVRIHSVAAMTGVWAFMMVPQFRGFDAYVHYLNETQGGINGHPIKHVWVDTAYEVPRTLSAYHRWRAVEDPYLVVIYGSPLGEALKSSLARDKVVGLQLYPSDVQFYPPGYTFGVGTTYDEMHVRWLEYIKDTWNRPDPPVLATMFPEFPWAHAFDRMFAVAAPQYGIKYAGLELARPGTPDLKAELRRLSAKGVNLIYWILTPSLVKVLYENAAELGLRDKLEFGAWAGVYPEEMPRVVPKLLDGTTWIGWWPIEKDAARDPQVRTAVAYWNKLYPGVPMEIPRMGGWMAAEIAAEAIRLTIKQVGFEKLNGENLKRHGFESIKDFRGLLHPQVTLGPDNQQTGTMLRVYKTVGGETQVARDWHPRPTLPRDPTSGAVNWAKYFAERK